MTEPVEQQLPVGPKRRNGQRGHLMAALMVMVAMMMIMGTIATQEYIHVLQRENEAEMMFRAKSITHAIRRYRRDNQGQTKPLIELKLLMEPGSRGQYFMRKLYTDPLVKDGEWGVLYAGPGGQIVDPSAPAAEDPFTLGDTSKQDTQSVGGLQSTADGTRPVGGLPIIGVKSLCKDQAFRVYRGLTEYREWLFTVYDVEPQAARGNGQGGQPGQPGQNLQNPPRGGGNRRGGGGFGGR